MEKIRSAWYESEIERADRDISIDWSNWIREMTILHIERSSEEKYIILITVAIDISDISCIIAREEITIVKESSLSLRDWCEDEYPFILRTISGSCRTDSCRLSRWSRLECDHTTELTSDRLYLRIRRRRYIRTCEKGRCLSFLP